MVSQNNEDGGRSGTLEDHSFYVGFSLGEAGETQGQDIVGEPILASLFVYAF